MPPTDFHNLRDIGVCPIFTCARKYRFWQAQVFSCEQVLSYALDRHMRKYVWLPLTIQEACYER